MEIKYIQTNNTITIFINGEIKIFNKSDAISFRIIECLEKKEYENLPKLMDLKQKIKDLGYGLFEIKNGEVYINGIKPTIDIQEQIINIAKLS